ncbi:MAG: TetR/AcrR family transcriptional regulator [Deltaproteobacteria bacterium]|nr:TetR/AcrR family transcriptional regulator [Deltaproteobacteria bacterium]
MKNNTAKKSVEQFEGLTPTETDIIMAAMEEFAEKGFFGARMQAIADTAGVNKAMLHYYFRSKENLYTQTLKACLRMLWSRMEETLEDARPIYDRLDRIVDIAMDTLLHYPSIFKILLSEVASGGERLEKGITELKNVGLTPAELLLEALSEIGMDRDGTTQFVLSMLGMCIFGIVAQPFLFVLFNFEPTRSPVFFDERRAHIKAMLRAYLGARLEAREV